MGKLTNNGILKGTVIRMGATFEMSRKGVQNHKLVAKSVSSAVEYSGFTNLNGQFELELPPGSYDLTAATQQGLREEEPSISKTMLPGYGINGNASVMQRGCTDVDFTLLTDGKLGGRVTMSDGRPARFTKIAIIPISPIHPQFTVDADENGRFEIGGRQPGQYLVGVGLLAQLDSAEWKFRVYYPGVTTREQAKVIELGDGEWRTDIDFQLPRSTNH
jgi:hypothetical protein